MSLTHPQFVYCRKANGEAECTRKEPPRRGDIRFVYSNLVSETLVDRPFTGSVNFLRKETDDHTNRCSAHPFSD